MQGMSERQYAAHVGLSRGAIRDRRRPPAGSSCTRMAASTPRLQGDTGKRRQMLPIPRPPAFL